MLEVIVLVVLAVVFCSIVVYLTLRSSSPTPEELRDKISSARERLLIIERKYMKGKIKKNIFSILVDQIEEEILDAELLMYRLKKTPTIELGDKVDKVSSVLSNPTKFRKSKIALILRETELLRFELGLLEAKFLKREITRGVFEKLVLKKESALVSKEKELSDFVSKSAKGKESRVPDLSLDLKK